MKRILILFVKTFIIISLFQLSGCSLIGLGIGSHFDSLKDADEYTNSDNEIFGLSRGESVVVTLKNNSTINARFMSFSELSHDKYFQNYQVFKNQINNPDYYPDLNEIVFIKFNISEAELVGKDERYSSEYRGKFIGYDFGSIILKDSVGSQKVSINKLSSLKNSLGKNFEINTLKYSMNKGIIPFKSKLMLNNHSDIFIVSEKEMKKLARTKSGYYWLIGLLVGGTIDYLILSNVELKFKGIQ